MACICGVKRLGVNSWILGHSNQKNSRSPDAGPAAHQTPAVRLHGDGRTYRGSPRNALEEYASPFVGLRTKKDVVSWSLSLSLPSSVSYAVWEPTFRTPCLGGFGADLAFLYRGPLPKQSLGKASEESSPRRHWKRLALPGRLVNAPSSGCHSIEA